MKKKRGIINNKTKANEKKREKKRKRKTYIPGPGYVGYVDGAFLS